MIFWIQSYHGEPLDYFKRKNYSPIVYVYAPLWIINVSIQVCTIISKVDIEKLFSDIRTQNNVLMKKYEGVNRSGVSL